MRRCLLVFLIILGNNIAYANDVVVLRDGNESYPLNRFLGQVEDKTAQLTLNDIQSGPANHSFIYLHKDITNFGFTDSAYWVRLDLNSRHSAIEDWLLEIQYPLLDRIDVFLVYPDGRITSSSSGDTLPFSQRAIKHRYPMFNIHLTKNESVTVYLRAKSEGAIQMPTTLRSVAQLMKKDHDEQYVLGIYYGILLALLIYNTMLYLSIRDANYLYYSMYIASWTFMQMGINGLAFEYLWPTSPQWSNISTPFFVGLVICSTIQFSSAFLQIKLRHPKLNLVFKTFLLLGMLVMIGSFLLRYSLIIKIAQIVALTGSVFVFIVGGIFFIKGSKQAKYFMLAWSMLLVGSIMYLMQNSGMIPTIFITEYGLQIGSAMEVLLFSFALAHRMKLLKEENERIQVESTENLERRVQQRTIELDDALNSLSDAHQKLKDFSRIDGLTGIKNRAYFGEKIGIEWLRGIRGKNSIGLLMMDIDHFKKINDTYGHLTGDICLKEVARTISQTVQRITDDAFRFGGEEFVVMLPATDLKGAIHMGELIRKSIEALEIIVAGKKISLTVSVGVACMTPDPNAPVDSLIDCADKALYQAKNNGRNQVCVAATSEPPASIK